MMNLKDKYPFNCPNCGAELTAAPSIMMKMGNNTGHGSCLNPDCNEFFHLEINDDNTEMIAVSWEEYLETVRGKNRNVRFFEKLTHKSA